jgi:hypothetical protein
MVMLLSGAGAAAAGSDVMFGLDVPKVCDDPQEVSRIPSMRVIVYKNDNFGLIDIGSPLQLNNGCIIAWFACAVKAFGWFIFG